MEQTGSGPSSWGIGTMSSTTEGFMVATMRYAICDGCRRSKAKVAPTPTDDGRQPTDTHTRCDERFGGKGISRQNEISRFGGRW